MAAWVHAWLILSSCKGDGPRVCSGLGDGLAAVAGAEREAAEDPDGSGVWCPRTVRKNRSGHLVHVQRRQHPSSLNLDGLPCHRRFLMPRWSREASG
jgi:hypothetical protein